MSFHIFLEINLIKTNYEDLNALITFLASFIALRVDKKISALGLFKCKCNVQPVIRIEPSAEWVSL